MSISKYHVSKNLFDEIYTNLSTNIQYLPINVGSGQFTASTTTPIQGTSASLWIMSGNVSSGAAASNNLYYGQNRTVTAVDGYITIAYRKTIAAGSPEVNPSDYDTMINSGSTALPYEPYGNSFKDWFYRKRETTTDTITALPKSIIADGQSASAVIKGNMSQSGTPTPASPIYPTETGDKTANLYFKSIASVSIDASGKLIGNSQFICYVAKVEANKSYIGQVGYVYAFFDNEPVAGSQAYDSQRVVANASDGITSPIDGYVAVRCNTGATDVMLNEGTTILPYQPFGYQIPILSGGVTTPVYLGEVQSERQIKKVVFTGSADETWNGDSLDNKMRYYPTPMITNGVPLTEAISTHFAFGGFNANSGANGTITGTNSSSAYRMYFWSSDYATVDAWKSFLAQQYANGTPVTVWYVLATPQTTTLNEPIRKIGSYADSVSVTGIPTTGTAEQFDVDTTLKPSEVSLTYHGWHEHSDTKF